MHRQVETIPKHLPTDSNRTRMSYAKFLDCEEVVPMAPVSDEHSAEQVFLVQILGMFVDAHNLGKLRMEPFQMAVQKEWKLI